MKLQTEKIGFVISAVASQISPKLKTKFGAMLIISRISSSPIFRNTRSRMINKRITSAIRATKLSTLNLLTQLPLAFIAYFMGAYIDNNSANDFAFIVGVGIIILLVLELVFFKIIALTNENII